MSWIVIVLVAVIVLFVIAGELESRGLCRPRSTARADNDGGESHANRRNPVIHERKSGIEPRDLSTPSILKQNNSNVGPIVYKVNAPPG
jgi:hypothetical protein